MFGITFRDPLRNFFDMSEVVPALSNRYNVNETDDGIVITTDLPGVKESDIEVSSEAGILSVRAARKDGTRSYYYSWTLPKHVDLEKINAEYEDGVLTLNLPKQEQSKRRLIEVKAKKQLAETAVA